MAASTQKMSWHRCRICGGLSDVDEMFCCGNHHEGPFEVVFLSPREILLDPVIRQNFRTKNPRPFSEPDS